MKNIGRRLGVVIIIACVLLCAPMVFASNAASGDPTYTIDTPYEYPIAPGTDEWNAIIDHVEKIELCQIPEDILPLMTTEALARTVVAYPLMVDMYAWDSTSTGYKLVAATFNGLQELESRPDGLSTLTTLLQENARTADSSLSTMYIKTIIKEMPANEIQEVSSRAAGTYVYTPNNHPIYAIKGYTWADHGTTFANAKQLQNEFLATYPSTTIYQNVSPVYNCHSFAWYSQSVDNPYWIDDPTQYWADGSYKPTTTWTTSTKIFYDNSYMERSLGLGSLQLAHSAVALSKQGMVRSKWGCNACFEHNVLDCPYNYTGLTFGQFA